MFGAPDEITNALRAGPLDEPYERPVGFSEGMDAAWRMGRAARQTVSRARERQIQSDRLIDELRRLPGLEDLPYLGLAPRRDDDTFARLRRAREERPDVGIPESLPGEIDRRTDETLSREVAAARTIERRPYSLAGWIGSFVGEAGVALNDPAMLATLPLGAPLSATVLRAAIVEAGIAAGTQAVIGAATASDRLRVDPQFGVGEYAGEVAGAAVGGAVLGGGFRALTRAWQRWRATGVEAPQGVRDAAAVIESEAQIESGNVFRSIQAEAEHRPALARAVDELLSDQPVTARLSDEALADALTMPPGLERLPEMRVADPEFTRQVEDAVLRLAREVDHELAPDDARAIARHLIASDPADAPSLIAELRYRPSTLAETIRGTRVAAEPPTTAAALAADPILREAAVSRLDAPEARAAVFRELDRARAMRDLQIPEVTRDPRTGEEVVTRRSLDAALEEFDYQARAAALVRECAIGAAT